MKLLRIFKRLINIVINFSFINIKLYLISVKWKNICILGDKVLKYI